MDPLGKIDVGAAPGVDVEMNSILGLLSFRYTLKEETRLVTVGINESPGVVPAFLRDVHLTSPIVPRLKPGGWRLDDIAECGSPEAGEARRICCVERDLE